MCEILQLFAQRSPVEVRLDLLWSCQLAWEKMVDYEASAAQAKRGCQMVQVMAYGVQRRGSSQLRRFQTERGPRVAAAALLTVVPRICQC